MAQPIPDTYRDIKIVKTSVRIADGRMPKLVTRLKCDVQGTLLEARKLRDLELQIDEQLARLSP